MRKERFLILLFSLLGYIIIDPILSPYPFGAGTIEVAGLLLFFSCIYAISDTKKHFTIAVGLFTCSILAKALINFMDSGDHILYIRASDFVISACFYGFAGFLILGYVMKEGKVTRDKIAAAICVYIILGVVWGLFYGLTETLDPGALGGGINAGLRNTGSAVYYSFITLTTVGYGDITPVSQVARSLAIVEGLAGQIYLAVMIARLVGLYTTHSTLEKD